MVALSWTALGAIIALVTPAYALIVGLAYRQGKREGVPDAVESNSDDIDEIKRQIQGISYEIGQLRRENETIHDNVTDDNHCDSPVCPWCKAPSDG